MVVVFPLESNARAPNGTTADVSRCVGFALCVTNSPTSRKLLPKVAILAAFHRQEVHGTAALILEVGGPLRLASELQQQRLDPRDVVEADAQVQVVVYSGLPAYQRIDAPATVNPIVDPTGVKGSQDLDYVLTRHFSHDAR